MHEKRTTLDGLQRLAELDRLIDVRERLVTVLDAIDQDEPDVARRHAARLLADFDLEERRA